ncbi:N-acetyl-1-D-myo-inositol-2-amino-2-deoxy-alpha-D-glucopyranoside deacetylase [Raineyella antarctica]|uniref:1D-myo-inositol 2-acetamido-2-deoxy-alpha-D-glucopyranoside deacetylase n=1 Tax=Raineyella antarctica TaxID=1577474 RepID=A0A1G6GE69_9ACTN|nr:N-acetyl-1-D-myo-inositol-2-amino-2-deoxy-alpha-D-glucopyranoside deacetylase [Raineyella antarctica]SDB80045.1 N-acetyl-1-D-myo-inositol-2-amino-2-deoxy-alpha-D-glucopyranoside deacetylase [Raineyella antarctica]
MIEQTSAARRLLLVHAHPDDETLSNGVTMAKYVAEGAAVTLVTCTLGEEGEIVVDDLAHLSSDGEDVLGEHRLRELAEAMAALGVTDHVRLGGDHRFRDSGMSWAPDGTATVADATRDDSFHAADLLVAANELVRVIRDRRPQVLVTYDEFGGYGHPDHVQAHRVATYATALAAVPSHRPDLGPAWQVQRTLWTAMSRSQVAEVSGLLADKGLPEVLDGMPTEPDSPLFAGDEAIAVEVRAPEYVGAKMAALRAHRSQIRTDQGFMTLPEDIAGHFWAREHYRFAGGVPLPGEGWATDVFAGLDPDQQG